ncbi:MAG: NAD-binding protein [Phycisphaerales bacterium]|nr:NAD-binding protein [Phycisphaerales bacterium]
MPKASSTLPIHIRPGNLQTSPAIEAWVHRKLTGAFRRYGAKMTAVEVHFEDVNGHKHSGDDAHCVMEARVNGRAPIAVRARAADLYAAIDAAARKLDSALSRVAERGDTRARRRFRQERGRGAEASAHGDGEAAPEPTLDAANGRLVSDPAADGPPRAIIAGYGPVGRALATELLRLRVPFAVIDTNPSTARKQEGLGVSVLCGDATDPAVLRAAGIETAAVFAVTIPDGDEAVRACAAARMLSPNVHIAARTTFLSQGLVALRAGANSITVEEIATAEAMAREVSRQMASVGAAAS